MTACIALLAVSLASALGGALLLHLWQTRPRRITRAGYTVGELPLRIRHRAMATRRGGLSGTTTQPPEIPR